MKLILLLSLFIALASAQALRGVNYGIQRPDGSCTNYADVLSDFKIIATFAQAVKIYNLGYCLGGQNTLQAAQATGLKVFLGIAAGPNDAYQNEKSLVTSLYQQFGFSNVLGITIGSEDLYRNSVPESTIAGQISEIKSILKALGSSAVVPVTHTDVYYLQPQSITSVSDIIMFNAFSFWEGVDIANAASTFISHYNALKNQFPGKTVWVGETGWPYSGATQAAAVANPANAQRYLNEVVCWMNDNGVPYFYFEAFDEPWKGSSGEIETSFGLYTSTRQPHFALTCGTSTGPSTPATSTPVDCVGLYNQQVCRTTSSDPSQVDAQVTGNAYNWLCGTYPQYCTDIVSGGKYSSCNSVERLSYAMTQYYGDFGPDASACDFGGAGHLYTAATSSVGASKSSTIATPASSSTTVPAVPVPTSSTPVAPTATNSPVASTGVRASYCAPDMYACGQACYSDTEYCCPNGVLTQKSFC